MWPEEGLAINIDELSENHLKKLMPLLWLDLTALYDRNNLPFQKRKPHKRKKKEGKYNDFSRAICLIYSSL